VCGTEQQRNLQLMQDGQSHARQFKANSRHKPGHCCTCKSFQETLVTVITSDNITAAAAGLQLLRCFENGQQTEMPCFLLHTSNLKTTAHAGGPTTTLAHSWRRWHLQQVHQCTTQIAIQLTSVASTATWLCFHMTWPAQSGSQLAGCSRRQQLTHAMQHIAEP
jgi:hypothetical protein